MSTDNTGLIVGGLVLAYLYMKRQNQAVAAGIVATNGAPLSMPGSVGSGVQQIKVGAIAGLLQGLASAPWNNTSQTVFPSPVPINNYGAVQDIAYEPASMEDMLTGEADTSWWA